MIKIVCDLCGVEVPQEDGYHLEMYDNKKLGKHITLFSEDEEARETYDVCEDCRKALAQFMSSRTRGSYGDNSD